METRKSIIVVLFGDLFGDARILRQSRALSRSFSVTILCLRCSGSVDCDALIQVSKWGKARFRILKLLGFLFEFWRLRRSCDWFILNDLQALVLGLVLRVLDRATYDAHEYWADSHYAKQVNPILFSGLLCMERAGIGRVASVVTVSHSIAWLLERKHSLPRRPFVIRNVPSEVPGPASAGCYDELGKESFSRFLYHGKLGVDRPVWELIRHLTGEWRFDVYGVGLTEAEFRQHVGRLADASKIAYHGYLSKVDFLGMEHPDRTFGVHWLELDCANHRFCFPNKFFDYLFCGLPVVFPRLVEIDRLTGGTEIGFFFDSENPSSIASACARAQSISTEEYRGLARNVCGLVDQLRSSNDLDLYAESMRL